MEKSLRRRHRHQRAHLPAPARLPEDRHVSGIAAELLRIVPDPLECRDDIEHPGVTRLRVLLSAEFGEIQVAKHAEPVIDRDHDHVVLPRKFGSVVADERARPRGISASVQPHHHRPLRRASAAGRPKIQDQAVLAHRPARIHRCEFRYHDSAELAVKLGRAQPVRGRFAHTAPRHRPRRRQEASAPGRRRAVRNALEAVHLPVGEFCAANLSGGSLDDRARCRAIAQRFREATPHQSPRRHRSQPNPRTNE